MAPAGAGDTPGRAGLTRADSGAATALTGDPGPRNAAALTALQAAWRRAYAGNEAGWAAPLMAPARMGGRAGADALAAWQRWHPGGLDALFTPAEWPWYAILERARVETLAGQDLPGMALNLSDLAGLAPAEPRAAWLYSLARRHLAATLADPPVADARILGYLEQARACLAQAATFADAMLPLARELALAALGDASDPGVPAAPRPTPLTARSAEAARDPQPNQVRSPPDDQDQPPLDKLHPHLDDENQTDPEDEAETAPTQAGAAAGPFTDRRYPGYAVFNRRWDQTLDATQLYQPGDALHLRQIPEPDQRQARRLALRLQRRLLAARLRRWSFDQDEGCLDSRRLARLLSRRPPYAVFRQEGEAPLPEACVTLLVDQSGSMRGLPQRLTAQAIDLAVRTLEIGGIRSEVLGYTTRYGADNPLVRAWQTAGCPSAPGRLNALRHIIYKGVDQPWRQCRPHLGLLLRPDLGRENIDGEALDWAARRLLRRSEPRKVLIVLSDGAPYDEASVAANGRPFLEEHLRAVIAALESSPIHLAAIGAGRTVGRFYRQALTLRQPDQVAELLFQHLGDLLTRPPGQGLA